MPSYELSWAQLSAMAFSVMAVAFSVLLMYMGTFQLSCVRLRLLSMTLLRLLSLRLFSAFRQTCANAFRRSGRLVTGSETSGL